MFNNYNEIFILWWTFLLNPLWWDGYDYDRWYSVRQLLTTCHPCDNMSPPVTTCHPLWQHVTPCDNMSPLWQHVTPVTTCHPLWQHVTPCDNMSPLWQHVTPCDNMSPCVCLLQWVTVGPYLEASEAHSSAPVVGISVGIHDDTEHCSLSRWQSCYVLSDYKETVLEKNLKCFHSHCNHVTDMLKNDITITYFWLLKCKHVQCPSILTTFTKTILHPQDRVNISDDNCTNEWITCEHLCIWYIIYV